MSSFYSCQNYSSTQVKKCEQLKLKARKHLNKDLSSLNKKLDSAIYYSELAYECDSTNIGILRVKYSAYFESRKYKKSLETLNKIHINQNDSIKTQLNFIKTAHFIFLDEEKYRDSIQNYYDDISEKFDKYKNESNFREEYPIYFDSKVMLEYYFKGKNSALKILNKYPSKYYLDDLDDLIRKTNMSAKKIILNYHRMR